MENYSFKFKRLIEFFIFCAILISLSSNRSIYISWSSNTDHAVFFVPDNYSTIQSAVNNANAGDTIIVRDGVYNENIIVDKSIIIKSENGPSNCTVIAVSTNQVFQIMTDNVTIEGFNIKHLNIMNIVHMKSAGIYLNGNQCTLKNNVFFMNDPTIFLVSANKNIILNNKVSNPQGYDFNSIYLMSSNNNTIINNNEFFNDFGIYLEFSNNNFIKNNTATEYDNNFGIYLSYSNNNKLVNNTQSGGSIWGSSGIFIEYSENNVVENNIASKNYDGILISYSNYTRIYNNTVFSNFRGLYLEYSSYNVIKQNIMFENYRNFGVDGTELSNFMQDIDTSNKADGKPLFYLIGSKDIQVPDNTGYIGIVNSSNIVISDLTLENRGDGVLLAYSNNCRIEKSNLSNNLYGIHLCHSNNTLISHNIFSNNSYGITLDYSENNIISNNEMLQSNYIRLFYSNKNNISNNTVSRSGYGIQLDCSNSSIITYNNFLDNQFGIHLYSSYDNNIYFNNFNESTSPSTTQDYFSYGSNNNWDSPQLIRYKYNGTINTSYVGNYWSEYEGNDSNTDGIGDTTYNIRPSGETPCMHADIPYTYMNKDFFPLIVGFEVLDIMGMEIDKNPPTTNTLIGSPQYIQGKNAYIGATTNISIESFDEWVNCTIFKIDDKSWMNYTSPFNLTGYAEGEHTLYYYGIDKAGNIETIKNTSIIIDTSAPITTPSPEAGTYSGTITVTLASTDNGSGVNATYYKIGDTENPTKYQEPIKLTQSGEYTINYYSIDNLGNKETTKSVTYTITEIPFFETPFGIAVISIAVVTILLISIIILRKRKVS